MMKQVMLDLETWGTRPGCGIRSVGAVEFELGGGEAGIGEKFYMNVARSSSAAAGLHEDENTVQWWNKQSTEARAALEIDPQPIREVVGKFHAWFISHRATFLWCHGAGFDEPIWRSAARSVSLLPPWRFRDVRCTRTIFHIAGLRLSDMKREGDHHNALDDAFHQVRAVQEAYHRIMQRKLT